MSFLKDLRYKFFGLSISEKLIVINSVLFVLNNLLVFLFNLPPDFFIRWFEFPVDITDFIAQPWSVVSYSFFHGNVLHLFWNMVWLYVSGSLFLNLFSSRRFITVYLLGAVSGGILFLMSYNVFPVFSNTNTSGLIGASAATMAILIFICTYTPYREIRLLFFNIKLWYIGVFFVLLDLLQLPLDAGNPGGHLAHLGGAFLGFFYARSLLQGKDIGKWAEHIIFGFIDIFTRNKKKTSPLKTVYKNNQEDAQVVYHKKKQEQYQQQIDAILDKISKSGYESLSKEEKDFLFKAGKE